MRSTKRKQAIVIGGSVAGLLAGRVLADYFDTVIVLERDMCPHKPEPRPGVPHSRQTHMLLPGGAQALEALFPGRLSELAHVGAQAFDYGSSHFHLNGHWMPILKTGLQSFAQSRPLLEHCIRKWVMEIPNLRIQYETVATHLEFGASDEKCVFSKIAGLDGVRRFNGSLIIDAMGRNTRLPNWLFQAGVESAEEARIHIDVGYTTGIFRIARKHLPSYPLIYIVGKPPQKTRVGAAIKIENGWLNVGMAGYHGDYPPTNLTGFLDFARSLDAPDIYNVLLKAEQLSPLRAYRAPKSVCRRYGDIASFPNGIIALGDSLACFDPVFAQGITVAAQSAQVLDEALSRHECLKCAQLYYYKHVRHTIETAWNLSRGENLKYPQTKGDRPTMFGLTRAFKDRVVACTDPFVVNQFYRVLTLTAPPRILLHPGVLKRVIKSHFKPSMDKERIDTCTLAS